MCGEESYETWEKCEMCHFLKKRILMSQKSRKWLTCAKFLFFLKNQNQ